MAEPTPDTVSADDYVYMHIGRIWAKLLALEHENQLLKRRLEREATPADTGDRHATAD